jgi:hypothetical protein
MDIQFEQQVNIKFCVKLGKTAMETLQLLHNAYDDKALSRVLEFPVRPSDQEAERQMAVNGFLTVKESEAAAIDNKDNDTHFLFRRHGVLFITNLSLPVNQEVYIAVLRRMREALRRRLPDLWPSGQWTLLHDNARPQDFLLNTTLLCFHITRTPLITLLAIFSVSTTEKKG